MGSSPTLLDVGIRTTDRVGWRAGVATALAVVLPRPSLWLLGAVGFAARGGVLLLALIIVVLPTPVEVRTLLGENLASSGLTPAFFALLVPLIVGAGLVVAAALLVAARIELEAFEAFVGDPELATVVVKAPERTDGRAGLIVRLFLVQLGALALVAVAAVPLLMSLYDATMDELLRPSPGGAPIYLRVLAAVRDQLLVLGAGVVVADIIGALASRKVMLARLQSTGSGSTSPWGESAAAFVARGLLRRPLSTLATALVGWLVMAGMLVPVAWALDVGWDATRAAYLGQRAEVELPALVWLAIITLVFVALWAAALVCAGFVSALRAALWTAEALR